MPCVRRIWIAVGRLTDETPFILAFVEVDASLANPASANAGAGGSAATASTAATGKKKKVPLNGGDKLFGELRDLNFAVVGGLLNKVAKRINADYEERHNAKTVPQIRQFIVKMGGLAAEHQSLRLRTWQFYSSTLASQ